MKQKQENPSDICYKKHNKHIFIVSKTICNLTSSSPGGGLTGLLPGGEGCPCPPNECIDDTDDPLDDTDESSEPEGELCCCK